MQDDILSSMSLSSVYLELNVPLVQSLPSCELKDVALQMGGVLGPWLCDKRDFLQHRALCLCRSTFSLANLPRVQRTWMGAESAACCCARGVPSGTVIMQTPAQNEHEQQDSGQDDAQHGDG